MDISGFDDWYAEAYPRLVAQLTALTGDRTQAQDVVQEAFIRASERRVDLPTRGERDAWIRTTAYRLSVSAWRRLRRGRELASSVAMTAEPGLSEDRADLFAALQRLPREQRQALVLHYFADRTVAQIADEIGAPEGTVKARLHRGRAALAAILTDETLGSPQ